MNTNVCKKCSRDFKTKDGLKYHMNKKVCKRKNTGANKKPFECKYCRRGYGSQSGMYKHMRTCSTKYDTGRQMLSEKRIKTLEDENQKLKKNEEAMQKKIDIMLKSIEELKGNYGIVNNQTINVGSINHINNTINLIAYGKEDLTKLTEGEILEVLQSGYNSPIKLTEKIHFNPERPENHNIYISNKKGKYASVYNGIYWTSKNKKEVVENLYEDKKNYIEAYIMDYSTSIPQSRIKALDRWIKTPEDHARIMKVKDDILMLLYDKREITKKTIEKNKSINKRLQCKKSQEDRNIQTQETKDNQSREYLDDQIQEGLNDRDREDLDGQSQDELNDQDNFDCQSQEDDGQSQEDNDISQEDFVDQLQENSDNQKQTILNGQIQEVLNDLIRKKLSEQISENLNEQKQKERKIISTKIFSTKN